MKKKVLSFISVMMLGFSLFTSVNAISVAEAAENMEQTGEYNSSRFIAGNKVTNKATVDGLLVTAGNDIVLEGSSSYGFSAGNSVIVNEKVEKDLFIAGNNVTIAENSSIGRDAYIFGSFVKINAPIGRDLRVGGVTIDLSGAVINGDVYVDASNIVLNEETSIIGTLTYSEDATVTGLNVASVGATKVIEFEEPVIEYSFKYEVKDFLVSVIASFIVLVVLFFIIPSSKEKLKDLDLSFGKVLKTIGIGLIVLIVVPILSIIGLFTGIFTPLALIVLALYVIGIYLSTLLIYYIVGNQISTKLFKNDNLYLALIIGILVVKLLKLIPVLGGLIGTISLFYGLGLIYNFIARRDK